MKCFIETIILCGFIFLVMKPVNGQTLSQKKIDIEFEKYEYANKNKDYIRMVEILKPLAKQGHTKSQAKLGALYLLGAGMVINFDKGVKLLRLAAEKGDSSAEDNLGVVYLKGLGVSKDTKTAVKWFERAVANGRTSSKENLAIAQLQLGADYWNKYSAKSFGKIIYKYWPSHKKEGAKWFQRSAKNGNLKAKELVARIFPNGPPFDRNDFTPDVDSCGFILEECDICTRTKYQMEAAPYCLKWKIEKDKEKYLAEENKRKEQQARERKRQIEKQQRLSEDKRMAEERRFAEEKRMAEKRRIAEEKAEKKRIAEEKIIERKKIIEKEKKYNFIEKFLLVK